MDVDAHIERLAADGESLADAAARAGWDAPVVACEWTVRDLVTHVGGIHRWAAANVGNASPRSDKATARSVGRGPDDDQLLDWFRDGHAALVSTLRAAPPGLDCFTFLPAPSARAFWARRQAHETAIHRADAESAAGPITPFDVEFAQDGMAELLLGFASRRGSPIDVPGTFVLRPDDGGSPWLVTLGGETIAAVEDDGAADAVVTGTSSDLYLWLWNRPADVRVSGDPAIVELWRKFQVRWN
jgi:uncharacterized protein (TIGR03083 family)